MASAFNPVTNDYRISVNTPDFPAPWIINQAEADALWAANVPAKYRKVVANIATEMTQAEKDAIDAALIVVARDLAVEREIDFTESVTRQVVSTILDEFNLHALKINAMLTAVDNAANLADLKTAYGAIADYPTRTVAQIRVAIRNKLGT